MTDVLFDMIYKLTPEKELGKKTLFPGIDEICWGIPTPKIIYDICKFVETDDILEIGAGTGLWAKLLNLRGINIIATDIGESGEYYNYNKTFYPIDIINGVDAIKKYKDYNVLLICWPPMNSIAYDCLNKFTGNKLIYIGEPKFGCTADDDFFELLDQEWKLFDSYLYKK